MHCVYTWLPTNCSQLVVQQKRGQLSPAVSRGFVISTARAYTLFNNEILSPQELIFIIICFFFVASQCASDMTRRSAGCHELSRAGQRALRPSPMTADRSRDLPIYSLCRPREYINTGSRQLPTFIITVPSCQPERLLSKVSCFYLQIYIEPHGKAQEHVLLSIFKFPHE